MAKDKTEKPEKLAPAAPAAVPSAERSALRTEIEARQAYGERSARLHSALDAASDGVTAARRALSAAEADIARAPEAVAAHFEAVAAGTAGEAPPSAEQLRGRLVDARSTLSTMEAARDALAKKTAMLLPALADERVREAAIVVMRAETSERVRAAVDDLERLERNLVRQGAAVTWLAHQGVIPTDRPGYLANSDPRAATAISRFHSPPGSWQELTKNPDLDGSRPLAAALTALMANAEAPIEW